MTPERVVALTDDTFDDLVGQSDLPVLVDFGAEWCIDCRMLAPSIAEIAEQYAGRAVVSSVDIADQKGLSERFKIGSIPTIIIFAEGQEVARSVGRQQKADVLAAIEKAFDQDG